MLFLNTQLEPLDIVIHALSKLLGWKEAKVLPDHVSGTSELTSPHENVAQIFRCQIDGSSKTLDPTSGLGWVCLQGDDTIMLVGAKYHRGVYRLYTRR